MDGRIRYLVLALILLLGLYPIIELTRVILISGEYYFPEMGTQFAAEIAIMWFLYLLIIPVFLLFTRRWSPNNQKMKEVNPEKSRAGNFYSSTLRDKSDYIRVNYNE